MRHFFIFMILIPFFVQADPWGKDADLAQPCRSACTPKKSSNPLSTFGQKMIRFHQTVLSPADGPRSHFYPCSSQYALNAIRKYGFFKGVAMGCDRLMRENNDEWVYRWREECSGKEIKYDPVP